MAKKNQPIRRCTAAAAWVVALVGKPGFASYLPKLEVPVANADEKTNVGVDAAYNGNAAGEALRGQLMLKPIGLPIKFGAGGGRVRFTYFNPQIFGLGSADLDTNYGESGHFYARGSAAYFPATDDTLRQYFQTLSTGTSWNLLPHSDTQLRLGFEVRGKWNELKWGINQSFRSIGAGVSFLDGPIGVYALGRWVLKEPNPTYQKGYDKRPYFEEMKTGILWNAIRGTTIGAEFEAAPFQKGGRAIFRIDDPTYAPEISLGYMRTSQIFGGENVFSIGLRMNLDKQAMSRVSVKQEVGGSRLERTTMRKSGISTRLLNEEKPHLLYAAGVIGEAEYLQLTRKSPATDAGRIILVGNGTNNEVVTKDAVKTENLNRAQTLKNHYGKEEYAFMIKFISNNNLDGLGGSYANSDFEVTIRAGAMLASIGLEYFDRSLKGGKNPETVRAMTPNKVFGNIHKRVVNGDTTTAGLCSNIHGMVVNFLKGAGVEAYALAIGSHDLEHTIVAARNPATNTGYVLNYHEIHKGSGRGLWPAIQSYARTKGFNLMGVYLYRDGNWRPALYKGPEGRLMDTALYSEDDLLRESLIRKSH